MNKLSQRQIEALKQDSQRLIDAINQNDRIKILAIIQDLEEVATNANFQ
jgi:hypothetical protein